MMQANRLYVIEFASGLVKFGLTCNVRARMKAISFDVYPDAIKRYAYTGVVMVGANRVERSLLDRAAKIGNCAFFRTEYFGDISFGEGLCLLRTASRMADTKNISIVDGVITKENTARKCHVARLQWMREKIRAMRGPYTFPEDQQIDLGSVILSSSYGESRIRIFSPSTGGECFVDAVIFENWALRQIREAIK